MMRERANKVDVEMPKRPERRGSVIKMAESRRARVGEAQRDEAVVARHTGRNRL
jgi:hypothetical protein